MPESDGGGSGAEDKARDRDLYQLKITFHYKEKQVERTVAETEWGGFCFSHPTRSLEMGQAGTEPMVLLASVLRCCP